MSAGPAVWMDMDQKALDDAYDQTVWAPNQPLVQKRRGVTAKRARAALGEPERFSYGKTPIESLELFRTTVPNAPVVVYVHGGAWKNGKAADFSTPAENFVTAGAHYIVLDFINVVEAGGDLMPMACQVRDAVAWVYCNAKSFGGDPEQLYVHGHSSGGHLSGCIVTTDWPGKYGLPATIVKGAVLASGMYDLVPVRLSKRSQYVNFTDEIVEELSAIRHIDRITADLIVAHGTEESPEFQRQARDFAAALAKAGKPCTFLAGEGYNHFEITETYASPFGLLGRAALKQMGLGPG